MAEFNRAILLFNPKYYKQADHCWGELAESTVGSPAVYKHTKPGLNTNIGYLAEEIGIKEGDAIMVIGGDGTFNPIAGAMCMLGIPNTFITPIGGGNANDIRRALHGRKYQPPSQLLKESKVIPASMLECTITDGNGFPSTHLAASYCGWGLTGRAAEYINSNTYQEGHRLTRDAKMLWGIISNREPLLFTPDGGLLRDASSLVFAKGPCMAKYGRLPIKYEDNSFISMQTGASVGAIAVGASRLVAGKPECSYRHEPLSFNLHTSTIAQFDGEHLIAPGQSQITIGLTTNTYNLAATNV